MQVVMPHTTISKTLCTTFWSQCYF